MKMCIKKVFCLVCQKLVRCREQKVDHRTQLFGSKCGHPLREWNGVRWRITVRE